jgi:methyl-accepting chemotaxis protein
MMNDRRPRFLSLRALVLMGFTANFVVLFIVFSVLFRTAVLNRTAGFIRTEISNILNRADLSTDTRAELEGSLVPSIDDLFERIGSRDLLRLAGMMVIVGIAGNLLIAQVVTRSIKELTVAANRISEGEFEQDLSHLYNRPYQSEISLLALAVEASGRAHLREQKLSEGIKRLEIQIDQTQRQEEAHTIMNTDFFRELQQNIQTIRSDL